MQARSKRRVPSILLPAAVLLLLIGIAYWNSFDAPLVFDDLLTIQANSAVQFGDDLRPSIWATRPILYLTFAINHALHGQQIWGYHLVNFILHFLNGILVFLIARHIFSRSTASETETRTCALLAAAFFVVHPVQTEAVTYVSSRSELLSTAFYGFAVLSFIKRDPRKIGFLWSLMIAALFLLGLFSKETVISLPVILVAYDFLFFSDARVREILSRWRFYSTFVAGGIVAIYFLLTVLLQGAIGIATTHISARQYFLTEVRVIVTYLRLLVLPVGLNLDYDFRLSNRLLDFPVLASSLLLTTLFLLGWYLRRRQPVISFSIFWFFITLAPSSSFVSIADVIFEHRLYLPLMGVSLVFPLMIGYVQAVLKPKVRLPVVAAASMALIVALLVGTVLRNQVWRDEITLWNDVIVKSPHKSRGYNNLAKVYFNRGEFDRALQVAQRGFRNVEDALDRRAFQQFMGNIYIQMHRYEDAAAAFRETTKVEDKHLVSTAYNNVGVAYVYIAGTKSGSEKQEILTRAAEAFRKSTDLDASMFLAFDSYVNVLYESGRKDELQNTLQSNLEENEDYQAYYGLGKIAFLSGNYAQAAQYFDKALQLNASQKLIFFNQAYALNQLHRRDEAREKYLQAIRLDPLFVQARHNLALLYMEANDLTKAIDSFENVLRLNPNDVQAHMNLAKMYIQVGNHHAARAHVSKVLSIAPEQQEAVALWRQLGS